MPRRAVLLALAWALSIAGRPAFAQDTVAAVAPLAGLRVNPDFVSPAQLHALQSSTFELSVQRLAAKQTESWPAGEFRGPGSHSEATNGLRTALSYGWQANASLTASVRAMHFKDATIFDDPTGVAGSDRRLYVLGADAAYKIMDRLVLALGASERRARIEAAYGALTERRYTAWQPALLLKSDWYELGVTQTAMALNRTQADGSDQLTWYREYALHASYHDEHGALGLIVRRNPMPDCCLASETRRHTYTGTYAQRFAPYVASIAYTHLPGFYERVSYGPVYDVARHRLESLLAVDAATLTFGLSAAYEYARANDAQVEIPDFPDPIHRANVAATAWRLGLFIASR